MRPSRTDTPIMAPRRCRSVTQPMLRHGTGRRAAVVRWAGGRGSGAHRPVSVPDVDADARPQMAERDFLEPGPVGREQVLDRAGHLHLAPGQHDQVGGDPLELRQHVRGEHDRDVVLAGRLDDRGHEVVPRDRVERGQRLVEHQQARPAGQRDRERELRLLPAGELADLLPGRDAEPFQPVVGPALVPAPVQAAGHPQHVGDRQVPVERRVLGDEGDPLERVGRARGHAAEHGHAALGGLGQADRHGEQGGLAGPVRADEGDDMAAGNVEGAVAQRPGAAVPLAERGRFDDVHDWLR